MRVRAKCIRSGGLTVRESRPTFQQVLLAPSEHPSPLTPRCFMRLLLNLLQLCLNLPWWGILAVVAGLAAFGYGLAWYVRRQFDKIVNDAVMSVGSALKDAQVAVHSVTAAPRPSE